VSSSAIHGGRVLWQEDLSELIDILNELEELRTELEGANAVSMQNYRMDKQIRTLAEKNRLHDELHRQTAHQIDLLNDWLKKLIETDNPKEKRELLRRIVVVEVEEGTVYELINPRIVAYSGEQEGQEGCLSVPDQWGIVKRPMHVTVEAMNRQGEIVQYTGHELLARAFCHELDHLDGKLYIDIAKMIDN
jgi:peptide deformylase